MKLGDSVMNKIEENKITPKSKSYFLSREVSVWAGFCITSILGMLSIATMLDVFFDGDIDIYVNLGIPKIQHFLSLIPYLWIISAGLLWIISQKVFRTTKGGYRHATILIVLVSASISIIGGFILFSYDVGETIHTTLLKNIPPYNHLVTSKEDFWNNPSQGLLSGVIQEISTSSFSLKDFDGTSWKINETTSTNWNRKQHLTIGEKVRLVGSLDASGIFTASKIGPWHYRPIRK